MAHGLSFRSVTGLAYAVGDAIESFARNGPHEPRSAVVPAVEGMTFADAQHALSVAGLQYTIVRLDEPPLPEMGVVVKQEPRPGIRVRRSKTRVVLTLDFPD